MLEKNDVLMYMRMIAELGGEYVPCRDFGSPAKRENGRKRDSIDHRIRPLRMTIKGERKYFVDGNGCLRKHKRLEVKP